MFNWKCPLCSAENTYGGMKEQEANSQCSNCKKKMRIYKYKIGNVDNQQKINNQNTKFNPSEDISQKYHQFINRNQQKSTDSVDKSTNHKYPHIIYVALKHYRRTWFKNKMPEKEGKMLDEWNEMEGLLKNE